MELKSDSSSTSMSYSAGSPHLEDDEGIYVFEEDAIDLQLELAVVRKQLRSTELAYRALENEYMSIRESSNVALVVLCDVDSTKAKEMTDRVQQDLDSSRANPTKLQTAIWHTTMSTSRDTDDLQDPNALTFHGADGLQKLQHFVSTFLPLAQVTRVYLSIAEKTTSSILLPIIKQTIADQSHLPASGSSPKSNSKTRTRSVTNTSTLSCLSRANNPDSILSKIILLSHDGGSSLSNAMSQLKQDAMASFADDAEILPDLQSIDFNQLFESISIEQDIPIEAPMDPPKRIELEAPSVPMQSTLSDSTSIASSTPVAVEAPESVVETSSSGGWAAVVRRGRPTPKKTVSDSTPSLQTSPIVGGGNMAWEPPTPTSPIIPSKEQATQRRKDQDTSPTRAKRGTRSSNASSADATAAKKELAKQQSIPALKSRALDPSTPLCKQKTPPCNSYFLTKKGCNNPKCNYSHSYNLSPSQLEEMRIGASKSVCLYRKSGQPCSSGEECVFGHVCPQGKRCKQGGRCHFPAHMH